MRYVFLILGLLGLMVAYFQPGEWSMYCAIVLIILVHELTHWATARYFGFEAPVFSIGFGSGPRLKLFTFCGTEFVMTPWLIGGYADVDPNSDQSRGKPAWQRLIVILSGTVTNILLAFALMLALLMYMGDRKVEPDGILVDQVISTTTSAAGAGFKAGDKIVSVDGLKVQSYADLHTRLAAHVGGLPAQVIIERDGVNYTLDVSPDGKGLIGVTLSDSTSISYRKVDFVQAIGLALGAVYDMGMKFIAGVLMIVYILPVPADMTDGTGGAHGLLSMIELGGIAFRQGAYNFASLVAFSSVNLAFLNMLPIPLFDGGNLLFFVWEKATGRPVSKERRAQLGKVFLWIVAAVMAYAMLNDILHPVA